MRRSTPRFDIVFMPPADGAPVVVHSALSADEATVLFTLELQRLLADRIDGELAILRKTSNKASPNVILRQAVMSA